MYVDAFRAKCTMQPVHVIPLTGNKKEQWVPNQWTMTMQPIDIIPVAGNKKKDIWVPNCCGPCILLVSTETWAAVKLLYFGGQLKTIEAFLSFAFVTGILSKDVNWTMPVQNIYQNPTQFLSSSYLSTTIFHGAHFSSTSLIDVTFSHLIGCLRNRQFKFFINWFFSLSLTT